MTVLGGPSVDEKDNQVRQSIRGLMRKLFQNNVINRTDITVKIFTIFCYILSRKLGEGGQF